VKILGGEAGIRRKEGLEGEVGSFRQKDVRRGRRKQKAGRY
jgi:hypothetical protein